MKIKSVHQFVPMVLRRDAIGETCIAIHSILKTQGYNSEIYVEAMGGTLPFLKRYTDYKNDDDALIIYHHAIGSDLVDYVCNLDNKKVLCFHNITPSQVFEKYDKTVAITCERGILQLEKLSKHFDYVMSPSSFSTQQLKEYGFKNILSFQYFMNLYRFDTLKPNQEILNQLSASTNILFVGRKAPNKKIDDLLKIFAYYKTFNPDSKLLLIGGSWVIDSYQNELDDLITRLQIRNDVILKNSVSDDDLLTYYRVSDMFLCMSEHEGFCIPIVEAMYFGVPILAYAAAAVPETLGGTSVTVNHKNHFEIAAIMDLLIKNNKLLSYIASKEKDLSQKYSNNNAARVFFGILKILDDDI